MSKNDEHEPPRRRPRPAPGEPRVSDKIRAATGEERKALIELLPWETGYLKPPADTRFQPGQSGNRKGRPKGRKNFRTVMETVITETVPVNDGGRRRKMPKLEVVVRQVTKKAMAGDLKATDLLLKQAGGLGLFGADELQTESTLADPHLLQAIWDHLAMQNAYEIQARTHDEEKG